MRLTIDSYIADMSPHDWVAAIPKASSIPAASSPYSAIEAEVRAGVPLPQAMRDARLAGTEAT
jgi:hypothetical protein